MTKTLQITDTDLGTWLDSKNYDSFDALMVDIVRLSREYGFEFHNQDTFEPAVPIILSGEMNEDMEIDFVFLVRDAVDYLNSFIIPDGYRFVIDNGFILTKWR